jgi:hypothetical protein
MMSWFKHSANARSDPKLERMIFKYGLKGYGLFFYILELVVININPDNPRCITHIELDLLARKINEDEKLVRKMVDDMVTLKLIDRIDQTHYACPRLLTRLTTSQTNSTPMRKIIAQAKAERKGHSIEDVFPDKTPQVPQSVETSKDFVQAWNKWAKKDQCSIPLGGISKKEWGIAKHFAKLIPARFIPIVITGFKHRSMDIRTPFTPQGLAVAKDIIKGIGGANV